MTHKNHSNYRRWITIVIMCLSTIVFFLLLNKIIYNEGDNEPHINLARALFNRDYENHDYPFHALVYPLYHFTVKIFAFVLAGNYWLAACVVQTICTMMSVLIMRHIILSCISEERTLRSWEIYFVDILSISLVVFNPIRSFLTGGRFYCRQCGPNPWHNPTIIFVRPFGLLTFWYFLCFFKKMKRGEGCKKEGILFCVLAILSSLAKPNFAMVFIPAACIFAFIYFIQNYRKLRKKASAILICVIPVLLLLLQAIFLKKVGASISFRLGSFSSFSPLEMVFVSLATFPVPIIVFITCFKTLKKEDIGVLSMLMLLFGWIEMFFFTNGPSGDFSWGYDLAVGIATMTALMFILKKDCNMVVRIITIGVYALQVFSGIHYAYLMYGGAWYWI